MLSTYTKNLTAREMLQSISNTSILNDLFKAGLKVDNDRVALAAMEELLRREDTDLVVMGMMNAVDQGHLELGTTMTMIIAGVLRDDRETAPELRALGKYGVLWSSKGYKPKHNWVKMAILNYLTPTKHSPKSESLDEWYEKRLAEKDENIPAPV